ncbi:hypothetical protein Trydic_g6631 [Trypoxylus dichotomus]
MRYCRRPSGDGNPEKRYVNKRKQRIAIRRKEEEEEVRVESRNPLFRQPETEGKRRSSLGASLLTTKTYAAKLKRSTFPSAEVASSGKVFDEAVRDFKTAKLTATIDDQRRTVVASSTSVEQSGRHVRLRFRDHIIAFVRSTFRESKM